MINAKTVVKIKFLQVLLQELQEELHALEINPSRHNGQVHLQEEVFFREFTHYNVSKRDYCIDYPYLYQAEVDGIIFFAISNKENPTSAYDNESNL